MVEKSNDIFLDLGKSLRCCRMTTHAYEPKATIVDSKIPVIAIGDRESRNRLWLSIGRLWETLILNDVSRVEVTTDLEA